MRTRPNRCRDNGRPRHVGRRKLARPTAEGAKRPVSLIDRLQRHDERAFDRLTAEEPIRDRQTHRQIENDDDLRRLQRVSRQRSVLVEFRVVFDKPVSPGAAAAGDRQAQSDLVTRCVQLSRAVMIDFECFSDAGRGVLHEQGDIGGAQPPAALAPRPPLADVRADRCQADHRRPLLSPNGNQIAAIAIGSKRLLVPGGIVQCSLVRAKGR
jgi:hypothetical protein